jgi:putative flavoprotein involved in K+ transport
MLRSRGADVVGFDRGEVGEAWTSRYDRLHLHTVRWLSSLPGYRMPRAIGKWALGRRRGRVSPAIRAPQRGRVRTHVEVERVDRDGDRWALTTNAGPSYAERVVVATGHNNVPFVPDWPGASGLEIVHSAAYRNPAPYAGRRVLVVGAGNSGAEIAVDLAEGGAASVLLSVRTPPSIVRRDTLGFPSQVLGIATSHLPVAVVDRIAATLRRASFPDLTAHGLPAPARPYSDFQRRRVIPILDVGLVDAVRDGRAASCPRSSASKTATRCSPAASGPPSMP